MIKIEKKLRKKHIREKRSDEKYLYYALERDLDRDALFPEHDGWYSEVSFGKRNRIDYIVKYNKKIYGIEVKAGSPHYSHFDQAIRYLPALNGIFLAYPSNRVGQALYESEKKREYNNVGLISLTLFRSHIIRKPHFLERKNEQIWKELLLDEEEYEKYVHSLPWEKEDALPATILKDGCFWVSYDSKGRNHENHYRLSFSKSDWSGLAHLYSANYATSLDRFFSVNQLQLKNKKLELGGFNLMNLVRCDLADQRSYGDMMYMFCLSMRAIYFKDQIIKALQRVLGMMKWNKLMKNISDLKELHRLNQTTHEKEFVVK